jgi:hypothetical protein
MRHPRLLILSPDDGLSNQLRPFVDARRWLMSTTRQPAGVVDLLHLPRPTVLLAQQDPRDATGECLDVVASTHLRFPEVATILVSDRKMSEADQAAWATLGYDCGAKFVLFPPITPSVLTELVSVLMIATIRRAISPTQLTSDENVVFDLASGEYEDS